MKPRHAKSSVGVLFAAAAIVPLGAAIIASCTLFAGLTADPEDGAPPATEAATTVDAGDGCEHAYPPMAKTGVPDGDGVTILIVGRSIRFTDVAPIGYDLDQTCTCTVERDAGCVLPAGATLPCDGDGGIDNVAGGLAREFSALVDLEKEANDSIRLGESAILVRVERYNGGPDDANITISWFRSFGPIRDADGGGGIEHVKPTFTLNDEWSRDPASLSATVENGSAETGDGYVANGILVATVPGFVTVHPALRINFQSSVITGRIVKSDGGAGQPPEGAFTLQDVLVAGRWPVNQALESLAQLTVNEGASEVRLCDIDSGLNKVGFDLARGTLCSSVDINANKANDRNGFPCNAISSGAAITTAPAASLGRILDAAPPLIPCRRPQEPCQ